jgi:hypothetical protein
VLEPGLRVANWGWVVRIFLVYEESELSFLII